MRDRGGANNPSLYLFFAFFAQIIPFLPLKAKCVYLMQTYVGAGVRDPLQGLDSYQL